MEPEKLGLSTIIADAHNNPDKYAHIIARRVTRLIMSEIIEKDTVAHDSMNPLELFAISMILRTKNSADRKAEMDACVQMLTPIIIKLIQDHKGEKTANFYPNNSLRELVAHASLQILANFLEKKLKKHELAHFLKQHTTSHPERTDNNHAYSLKLIGDKDRMTLMDHGIVNVNPLSGTETVEVPDENDAAGKKEEVGEIKKPQKMKKVPKNRLWIGHDTQNAFKPEDTTGVLNIIVEMSADHAVQRIIEGENLYRTGTHIVSYDSAEGLIRCYSDPIIKDKKATSGYTTEILLESKRKLGNFVGVRTEPVMHTDWSAYEIIGSEGKVTFCIHRVNPEFSFSSNLPTSRVDNTIFIVDVQSGCVSVLSKESNIAGHKIDIDKAIGTKKGTMGEAFFYIDTSGQKKKMTFEGIAPVFSPIETSEEKFFQETK
ncbi:hypothetical protein KA050_02635 [Candidatus Gracilibacteria bacterium]|nr:hypothetical protein [Candidatus Gracilibacteria bacterium]